MTKVSKGYTVEEGVFYYLGEYWTVELCLHTCGLWRCVLCLPTDAQVATKLGPEASNVENLRNTDPALPLHLLRGCPLVVVVEPGKLARLDVLLGEYGPETAAEMLVHAYDQRVRGALQPHLPTATQTHVSKARHLCEPKP
jgi:hypothetical protein